MGWFKGAVVVLLAALGTYCVRQMMRTKFPKDAKGFCKPRFAKVKEVFRQNLESGAERGGAFAVYHEGQLVCDLWGGFADESIEYPWQEDTLSIFFSATKAVCAFCLMLLADRGHLDFDRPVAQYWPEFAQNGKENISVKQLVSHQAGLAATDEQYSILLVKSDPDKMGRILAAQRPLWTPGTQHGYHALTFGLYVDQLLRRVDPKHRGVDRYFREEIGIPFDIDFFIGLPKEKHYRVAKLMSLSIMETIAYGSLDSRNRVVLRNLMTKEIAKRAFYFEDFVKVSKAHDIFAWPEYREIPQGSTNGFGTARGLAKLYGILADGGKLGDRALLSSPATLSKLNEVVVSGIDSILGLNITRGYGTIITGLGRDKPQTMFGHPGSGGQIGFGDPLYKVGWSYLTNYPAASLGDVVPHYRALRAALYETLQAK